MNPSISAFTDELLKIAEQTRSDMPVITRERLRQAALHGLAAAGGYGLGTGLGHLVSDTVMPAVLQKYIPNPGPGALQKGMLIAAGLGGLGSFAHSMMKERVRNAIARAGDNKPQDFLMGHDKLNPQSGGPSA